MLIPPRWSQKNKDDVMILFLGQQALNKRSNPTINVVVYFHTEQTATTAKTLDRLETRLQSLRGGGGREGLGIRGYCFRYNNNGDGVSMINQVTSRQTLRD